MTLIGALACGGCFLVAAGAGAGAAVVYTSRGAKSVVDGSVTQTIDRTATAFQQLGITETGRGTEESGAKGRLVGTKGELEVTVEINRASETSTNVEVYAKKNAVTYDKDFARTVLDRVVQR